MPFRTAVARLQRIDPRNTWQVVAGAIFVPLGIVIILIAWYGSAHTPYIQQQIPYLVSGSFIGLGFMVLGGLLYWAHWLYRVYDQADLQHAAQLARQEELFERLIEAVGGGAAVAQTNGTAPTVEELVVTASGTNVHRTDCPIVQRHPAGLRRVDAAEAAGLRACRICQPHITTPR